ncbi:MAG TPA: MATE family efflux transporter, partial [bacterium]|nr:MATE family efflux transporter [bacterium]
MAARNLSQGPVPKLVVVLALPVLATFLLQSAYALADLWFVGRLGGDAIAALSICLNTFFVVLALGQSVGTGGLAMISQCYGRGEHAVVKEVFQQVVWLGLLVGTVVWLLGWYYARPFVSFFTADPNVLRLGTQFFRIYAATFLTQVLLLASGYAFRAVGDFILPTIVLGGTVLLNVALDPLLIFGLGPIPALGVEGA